ncbi:uncharacterized protein LOC122651841 isoform X2 [Telopea speciosissima]|uniref:uncharacterized protein LOC122651841 isoform X2 n=1 Tax=Telopea speciosissima TaxID=54955 RepID=UPI001CC792BF|nr:uncharacterized protein LOC122651841 isoform X2 [Telopea speciosissima]
MAIDQNSILKDLRPLNVARTIPEEHRIAAAVSGRNVEGFFPSNPIRDGSSPRSRQAYYPAATVSDAGFVGLGFGNPAMAWLHRTPPAGTAPSGYTDIPHSGNRIWGNAADQAIDEGGDDLSSAKKIKLLCSFGGKILPRPSDGTLRYVGGQTRIIGLRSDISFNDLVQKMVETSGQPVVVKYQLPDEDLDALVSVSCQEDLQNMMEEYEKLVESSSDGSAKLRVFLFSASELDSSELVQFGDLPDTGQKYVDAVNGIPEIVGGGITRKESAASTQNSDSLLSGGDGVDSSGPGLGGGGPSSPTVSASPRVTTAAHDATTRFFYVGPNPVRYTDAQAMSIGAPPAVLATLPQISSSRPELEIERTLPAVVQPQPQLGFEMHQPTTMEFPPASAYMQAYVDPHLSSQIGYANPQLIGIPPGSMYRLADNMQQLPHQFVPAVHMTKAAPSPHVGIKPIGVQAVQQFMQPQQVRMDPDTEENAYGQRVVQPPSDQNFRGYQTHSTRPQVPVAAQTGGYGWHQVQPPEHAVSYEVWVPQQQGIISDKIQRLEDCYMCQKALPHAHSDTLVQDQRESSASSVSDTNLAFHSLNAEDNMRARLANRVAVAGALVDGSVEPQGSGTLPRVVVGQVDPEVTVPQFGVLGFSPNVEGQHDNDRVLLQKVDSRGHPRMFPTGVMGVPGDAESYSAFMGNIPQGRQEDGLQQPSVPFQYPVKQEAFMNRPVSNDNPPVRVVPFQTSEPLVHEFSTEYSGNLPGFVQKDVLDSSTSYDHLRTIDGRMEALQINSPENSGSNEQCRSPVNRPKKDETLENRPQIAGKEMFHANSFIKPGIAPDGNHLKPIETVEASSTEIGHVLPVECNQLAQPPVLGNSGQYLHLQMGHPFIVPDEVCHGKAAFSGVDSSYAPDRVSQPFGEWNDAILYSRMVPNDAVSFAVAATSNVPSSVPLQSAVIANNWNPAPSNSLFSSRDPWNLRHDSHFLPPRSNKVPMSKEPFVTRDLLGENRLGNNGESSAKMRLEGVLSQSSGNLNKDLSSENLCHVKGAAEEQIKQDLQAVAEGVAASVLQSSLPSNPDSPIHENNELQTEATIGREVHDCGSEAYSIAKVEDMKTKLSDKTSAVLPISGGIGRLQIIKNSDLEELRELGSGTFGTVYHGKWRGTDVAIKRINDRCFAGKPSEQERMRDDFWNEAIKLADLHHPNVVAFYGVVLDGPGGSVATVTEYMVNGSLRTALQKNDKILDKRKRLLIAMDVAFGMEYLHQKKIVHFDLKSDNLLVNLRDPHRPICKVGDLGLSKVKCQTLISGGVRGTLPWMAPELLNDGSSLVSEKVDVFSFGIVLWELLTGEEPYADLHYGAIIGGIVSNTLRPLVPESCDPEWRSLMERCWSSEPSERPSFTEIANELRAIAPKLSLKGQAHHQQQQAQK